MLIGGKEIKDECSRCGNDQLSVRPPRSERKEGDEDKCPRII